jgi:hypothetical protein
MRDIKGGIYMRSGEPLRKEFNTFDGRLTLGSKYHGIPVFLDVHS